jgi:hypothetical protein
VWFLRADGFGDTAWTRTYGGADPDLAISVQQTTDGGYVIAGWTASYGAGESDVWLIKTNANGDTVWTKTFGGTDYDEGCSVQQTTDGGYIIVGTTQSFGGGGSDVWLIKTDANGDTVWTRTYGGVDSDGGSSVHQTSDGGYIVAGTTWSYGSGSGDIWLVKADASGDLAWAVTFGGAGRDDGFRVQQTTDGGYVIAGRTESYGAGDYDVWLLKTDANGDTLAGGGGR